MDKAITEKEANDITQKYTASGLSKHDTDLKQLSTNNNYWKMKIIEFYIKNMEYATGYNLKEMDFFKRMERNTEYEGKNKWVKSTDILTQLCLGNPSEFKQNETNVQECIYGIPVDKDKSLLDMLDDPYNTVLPQTNLNVVKNEITKLQGVKIIGNNIGNVYLPKNEINGIYNPNEIRGGIHNYYKYEFLKYLKIGFLLVFFPFYVPYWIIKQIVLNVIKFTDKKIIKLPIDEIKTEKIKDLENRAKGYIQLLNGKPVKVVKVD